MGMRHEAVAPIVSDAIALAERIVHDAEDSRFDVGEYTRRARRLLEATAKPAEPEQLF
jgi:hypothetical protein